MPVITKTNQLPLRGIESMGMNSQGKEIFKATFQPSFCFDDSITGDWISAQLQTGTDFIRARNSRLGVVVRNEHVQFFDREVKEEICKEDITLVAQESVEPYRKQDILNSASAINITIDYVERDNGFVISKTLSNATAQMQISYKILEGQRITRDIKYRWKLPDDRVDVRFKVRWSNLPSLSVTMQGKSYDITHEEFTNRGIDHHVFTAIDFEFKVGERVILNEDTFSLWERELLGNTLVGVHDDSEEVWVQFWTLPRTVDSNEDDEVPFDATWSSGNPTRDGFVYQERIVTSIGYADAWFYKSEPIQWGHWKLTSGRNDMFSRGHCQWSLSGLPTNIAIFDVEIGLKGLSQIGDIPTTITEVPVDQAIDRYAPLWDGIGNGRVCAEPGQWPSVGVEEYEMLDSQAKYYVHSQLDAGLDWINYGFKSDEPLPPPWSSPDKRTAYDNSYGGATPLLNIYYQLIEPEGTELHTMEIGGSEIG